MSLLRPATPGTVVVLAATVLLVLASISTPIVKSIYFLQVGIGATSAQASGSQVQITLGTFGYAVGQVGFGPSLGYTLNAAQLLGLTSAIDFPEALVKGLTYVLILHPIAAGFAGIALLCGMLAHISGMSMGLSIAATWFASIGCVMAALAFGFDMACFTIAKSRISNIQSDEVTVVASYGNAIWITLAAFVLLLAAGCCFGCGRRIVGSRNAARARGDYKPAVDPGYAADTRQNALLADRLRRADNSYSSVPSKEGGLPAFAEAQDSVPLHSYNGKIDDGYDEESQTIAGVGHGFGRREDELHRSNTGVTAGAAGVGAGGRAASPPHVESFQSMYTGQPSEQGQSPVSPSSHYAPTSYPPLSANTEYAPMPMPFGAQQQQYSQHEAPSPATSYQPSSMAPWGEARQSAVPFLPQTTSGPAGQAYSAPYYSSQASVPTSTPYHTRQSSVPASYAYGQSGPPTYRTSEPRYSDPYAAVDAATHGYSPAIHYPQPQRGGQP